MDSKFPPKEQQELDPAAADSEFESCTEELIRRTRDTAQFPLVFTGLIEYGFRRNLLGLKPFGLTIAAGALAVCIWRTYVSWDSASPPTVAIIGSILNFGLLLTWVVWNRVGAVRTAADRYARFLLEAALALE